MEPAVLLGRQTYRREYSKARTKGIGSRSSVRAIRAGARILMRDRRFTQPYRACRPAVLSVDSFGFCDFFSRSQVGTS